MNALLQKFRWQDAAAPFFAIVAVLALLFRLPNEALDLLLSINLALSTIIFLSTFFVSKPLEFSSFPTVLLLTTLYRLVLNVSTTRLILTQGDAGQVIDAFSRFVAGDNLVVGAVVFLIFIIVQFIVITKGATRISEVSARFALDALPGRQTAIDFDLNSGAISASEARRQRAELSEQADFFGSMDGASKFVRGDAIASLVIVFVNVIGGLIIGVAQQGVSLVESLELYAKLTIGDGLASQTPALLISLASGLLVARTSRSQNVSEVVLKQTFGRPIVLGVSGVFFVFLSFTGLPIIPLLTLACGCFALAWGLGRKNGSVASSVDIEDSGARTVKAEEEEDVGALLDVEPVTLEIGIGLISVAQSESDAGGSLLERVRHVRQNVATELGVVIPKVKIRDEASLDENQFCIKVHGVEVFRGNVYPQMLLAVDNGLAFGDIQGLRTSAPGKTTSAFWIERNKQEEADAAGYEVWSPGDVIEKRLLEVLLRESSCLLTRDSVKRLLERLRETSPTLVAEALNESDNERGSNLARIQHVLQLLLYEGVSIRRLDVVLESIVDLSIREPLSSVYRALEYARVRSARVLSSKYRDEDATLRVAMFDPESEDALRASLIESDLGEPTFSLGTREIDALKKAVSDSRACFLDANLPCVFLVERSIRFPLRRIACENPGDDVVVLSFDEIDSKTKIVQEVGVDWKP